MGHLRDLYGLNPAMIPFALQFPRLPPGLSGPMAKMRASKGAFQMGGQRLAPQLQDFKEMYQQLASGLADFDSAALIPPGHPLYSAHKSAEILRAENNKLRSENTDLKKQVERPDADVSRHNP